MISSGFVLRYVLPPGSGRIAGDGSGYRAVLKPVAFLWGLTRHQWGEIHFWMSVGLMAILALHLSLHWSWIVCVIRRQPKEGSGVRFPLGVAGFIAIIFFALAPFLGKTEKIPRGQIENGGVLQRR